MKYILLLTASILLFFSCKNDRSNDKKEQEQTTETKSNVASSRKTIQLTKADFLTKVFNFQNKSDEWVYLGDKPAIVDFYADWCPPCRAIAPILEELAAEYEGQIYIYKINIDNEKDLARQFNIQSIPTLLFISTDGKVSGMSQAPTKTELVSYINKLLKTE